MATAQINVRINPETKQRGDRALSEIGFTPTRAIRALWRFAGENLGNGNALRTMLETLENTGAPNAAEERERRVLLAESGPLIFEQALADLGATPDIEDVPYDELLEQAYVDKMTKRGTYL